MSQSGRKRRVMAHSGLTKRLILSHVGVALLVTVVAGAALLTQSRRYFVGVDRRALLIQARAAAASCNGACVATGRAAPGFRNATLPSGAIVSQNRNITEEATSIDPATQRIQTELTTTLSIVGRGAKLDEPAVVSAFRGLESSTVSGSSILAAAPIRDAGSVVGVAIVRGDLSDVEAVLSDLRRALIVVLAASALLASAVGFARARAIAKPLRSLTASARAVAEGDFSAEMPTPRGNDELALLIETFSSMRDRVTSELATRAAFVADASHELRTPLTAIRGSVEILQDGAADDPAARARFLVLLERETDRLLALVDGLLDLDSAERVVAREVVDLVELCRSVVGQLNEFGSAMITLDVTAPVVTMGNPAQLRQVLLNLLDNALTHGGSNVMVCARMGSGCVVEITDDGPGIPDGDRGRILERFVRLDPSRRREVGHSSATRTRNQGSGLGLSIVQAIVTAHGGQLTLRDRALGTGTTVVVELPSATTGER